MALRSTAKNDSEALYESALDLIRAGQKVTAPILSKSLRIGSDRASRIMDKLECRGVLSARDARGKREVLLGVGS